MNLYKEVIKIPYMEERKRIDDLFEYEILEIFRLHGNSGYPFSKIFYLLCFKDPYNVGGFKCYVRERFKSLLKQKKLVVFTRGRNRVIKYYKSTVPYFR